MNPLVEYMEKHHNPGGNAIEHAFFDEIIDITGWSKTQTYDWLMEGKEAERLSFTPKTGTRIGEYGPDDIEIIGIWNILYSNSRYRRKET